MKHYHWTLVSSWISGDVVSQNSTQANKEVCASFTKSAPWRRSCHNLSSSHCEYSAIYNESNFFLFPRRIIAAIHQNLANDVFHRFPSVWENRATEMEAQRHKSCQIRAELGSESPTEGKTKFKKKNQNRRKQIINSHLWTMHLTLHVWAANDMHRLGGGGEVFLQHNLPHLTATA